MIDPKHLSSYLFFTEELHLMHSTSHYTRKRLLFIFVLALCVLPAFPDRIDTTLFADGGPGPYELGRFFVDSSSITVQFADSAAPVPPWTFLGRHNAILFSLPLADSTALRVRYETDYFGLPKVYSLYKKTTRDIQETDTLQKRAHSMGITALRHDDNLQVSGYKSIGVSVGSYGQINLEQGLDVRIGGEIRPGTEIGAHLSDEGTSLDGTTREISEFDMIYISLTDPSYRAVAGDQYVSWPFEGILSGQKKIKGLSASYFSQRDFNVGLFGALAGGIHAVETRKGQNGIQGPYYLEGGGNPGLVTPVGGTVKIRINGRELDEGEDKHFVVDYDLGSITFTPRVLVTSEDLIRIEYEYKTFDYQKMLLGTTAGHMASDSVLSIEGVLWSEQDNGESPIDLVLSEQDRDALRQAGDLSPMSSTARSIHPNDVPAQDAVYPLYTIQTDSAGRQFYHHTRYDPNFPEIRDGFYHVWFQPAGKGKGDYALTDSAVHREQVFRYVYPGNGDYSSSAPLSAPVRLTTGEIRARLRLPLLAANVHIAGQDRDKNLFSSLDDNDNQASASHVDISAGKRQTQNPGVWLNANYRFYSSRFDAEALSAYERRELWNDTALTPGQASQQQWESTVGSTFLPGLWGELGYGQNRPNNQMSTDKIAGAAGVGLSDPFSLEYHGVYFRHHREGEEGASRREDIRLALAFKDYEYGVTYQGEWRTDSLGFGAGSLGGALSFDYRPLKLNETLKLTQMRKGANSVLWSRDTGYSVLWRQAFDYPVLPTWKVSGSSNYYHSNIYEFDRTSTMLISLLSDYQAARSGFASRQSYTTSSEKATAYVQIPRYAGKGMGTHAYDSTLREYVPRAGGDFFLTRQEVFDNYASQRVKKTSLELTWNFDPQRKIPGILNDLDWQGTMLLTEHLDATINAASSWVPGYYSLKPLWGRSDPGEKVTYADLSYRQDVKWRPEIAGLGGGIFTLPLFRKFRDYREESVETGFSVERQFEKWFIGLESAYLWLEHEEPGGSSADFSVTDLHGDLIQKYRLIRDLDLCMTEGIGQARKKLSLDNSPPPPSDSTLYFRIRPGIEWRPAEKGWAEAYYTFSVVNIPGALDYRMANGALPGVSHVFSVAVDVKTGKHFSIGAHYRGEISRAPAGQVAQPSSHVVSMEVKAYL